jgi:hypothetical protein
MLSWLTNERLAVETEQPNCKQNKNKLNKQKTHVFTQNVEQPNQTCGPTSIDLHLFLHKLLK